MRRFRQSHRSQFFALAIVAALVVLRLLSEQGQPPPVAPSQGVVVVERVVDGDTLVMADGRWRVRLQGINTPETVAEDRPIEPWGPEASAFTKAFVSKAGGRLRFEVDGETIDAHGRRLGFMWDGDRMLNEELVRAGLARVLFGYDYSQAKKDRLRKALREAQRERRGIWSSAPN